jgi:hypothetical protein
MLQLIGRIVVIQQGKIETLDTREIDFISGGNLCDWLNFCRPPWRIDGGDPMEPTGPVIELEP